MEFEESKKNGESILNVATSEVLAANFDSDQADTAIAVDALQQLLQCDPGSRSLDALISKE